MKKNHKKLQKALENLEHPKHHANNLDFPENINTIPVLHVQSHTPISAVSYIPKIKDYQDTTSIGISLFTEEALQTLSTNSGPLTTANEFQVHYWALNLRKQFEDKSIIDISIPTVFFNYKQEVSSAHIDFELSDVEEISKQLAPIHNIEVNILKPLLEPKFLGFEFISVSLNSIHKHPGGRMQGFSGTDLGKNHTNNTGIVFPLSEAKDQANFASIMCIQQNKTYLAHTEYRIADGNVETPEGISYYNGVAISYVKAVNTKLSQAEQWSGIQSKTSYTLTDNIKEIPTNIQKVMEIWDTIDYVSNTEFVFPDNVSKKSYFTPTVKGTPSFNFPHTQTQTQKPTTYTELQYIHDDKLIKEFRKVTNITIIPRLDLMKYSPFQKALEYARLECHLYELQFDPRTQFEHASAMVEEEITVREILELQEEILEEFIRGNIAAATETEEDDLVDSPMYLGSDEDYKDLYDDLDQQEKIHLLAQSGVTYNELANATDDQINELYKDHY